MPTPFTHSRSGMSLLNIIILLMLIGVLTTAGVKLIGPAVQRGKINDTKTTITSNVDAIISWAVANGRLPTATELQSGNLLPNPNDAWGRALVYAYDNNLTTATTGGLCGRTSVSYNNIAFVILSGGDDFTTESTPATSQALSAAPDLSTSDLYRVVTLDELKNRAGCYGATGGRLRIVNNELPMACAGQSYSANLYADGGITGSAYTWSTPPATDWTIDATTGKLSRSPAPTVNETVTITLSNAGTSIQRSYNLQVKSCGSGPITFANDFGDAITNEGRRSSVTVTQDSTAQTLFIDTGGRNDAACLWYKTADTLSAGTTMKVYFEFRTDNETRSDSTRYGDGFTFAILDATTGNPNSTCGSSASNLAYDGVAGITAVEFDTYRDNGDNDPISNADVRNHMAIHTASTLHPAGECAAATDRACSYTGTHDWFEDGVIHRVRIDIEKNTGLIKAWLDCVNCDPRVNPSPPAAMPTVRRAVAIPASAYFGFTFSSTKTANQTLSFSNFVRLIN